MYEILIKSDFSGAHNLKGYKGKCEELHGHNWKVEVGLSGSTLNSQGMIMDFKELKEMLKSALSDLDHRNLNDLACFKKKNPTSENIAQLIYSRLANATKRKMRVSVWETDTSCASFEK